MRGPRPAEASALRGRPPADEHHAPVTEVVVRSEGPSYGSAFDRSPALGALLARAHTPTAPDVIRHFVLLKRGKDLFWILLGFVLMALGQRGSSPPPVVAT